MTVHVFVIDNDREEISACAINISTIFWCAWELATRRTSALGFFIFFENSVTTLRSSVVFVMYTRTIETTDYPR